MRKGLLDWQWSLYPGGHRDRVNLLLHILTVPLFWAGTALLVVALLRGAAGPVLAGLALWLAALLAQGQGHQREREAQVPFEGPLDFISRFTVEQFITFPRFLLSGGWARALRDAR
ncbi:MAG: terminase [Alphaproteobacteria bacterium]|nr:terminase [Alphaproteobacteria bacterium]